MSRLRINGFTWDRNDTKSKINVLRTSVACISMQKAEKKVFVCLLN